MRIKHILMAAVTGFTLLGSSVAQAALVNHWTFDEVNGLDIADSAGTSNGTWQDANSTGLSWGTGQIGGAAVLAGDNNTSAVFDVGSIGINGATAMTISMWIQPELSQNGDSTGIFVSRDSSINRGTTSYNAQFWGVGWEKFNTDDRRVRADSTGTARSSAVYDGTEAAPEWINIVVTWEGDGPFDPAGFDDPKAIYVNGVLDVTEGFTVNADLYNSGTWLIGGDPDAGSNRMFGGAIDDLTVWDEAITAEDAAKIYAGGLLGYDAPTAIDLPKPNAPSDLSSTVNGSNIDLTWTDNSDNETGFYIYQSTDGGAYERIHTTAANVTAYTVQSLDAASYSFRVTAYNVAGESSQSVPTSSGVDLRAYQAADGVYVEFMAYDVEADGSIQLAMLDASGAVVWSSSVDVTAGQTSFARFRVPGLERGGSYNFQIRDEVGTWWESKGIRVKDFATKMTSATNAGITLSFDSLAAHDYEIQWAASLGSLWQTVDTITATGSQTSVVIAPPDPVGPSGFFRIRLK